ncbi:MAG: response regulator [Candidatus Eisenbacteria bacterium]|uniref:Response regulator transcription factor n=1 Tax=Eiseniibacteriota bacterium TaxID=2212470 RepID=A0A956RR29_UNCEI|nr:response regulator transcription factor [Candidatus Eisenbacteria bacterium]
MKTSDPMVFLVDDDPGIRKAMHAVMDSVGLPLESFESAEDFLERRDAARPGCLLLDLRMPGMNGLDLLHMLRTEGDTIPVIFISGHGDVPSAVQAMRSGADDFLEKPFSDTLLVDRVREAFREDERRRKRRTREVEVRRRLGSLTRREAQVMELVIAGHSSKDIAAELGISLKTVEHHRIHLLDKMRVDTAVDLTREVVAAGLAGTTKGNQPST